MGCWVDILFCISQLQKTIQQSLRPFKVQTTIKFVSYENNLTTPLFSFIYGNSFETLIYFNSRLLRDSRDIFRPIIILINVKNISSGVFQHFAISTGLCPAQYFQVGHLLSLSMLDEMIGMIEIFHDMQV